MRANAMEKLLSLMVEAYMDGNAEAMANYVAKARIIMDRSDDKAASVIRELVNN